MRVYPVGIPVFTAIFNYADPRSATGNVGPEIRENSGRYIRVANDIVRLANQFSFTVTADFDEIRIGVDNAPSKIRARNDDLVIAHLDDAIVRGTAIRH